jgi:hypothetical protein
VSAAGGIVDDVRHDAEAVVAQKSAIFVAVQACVIKRLAAIAAQLFAGRWAAGEQQRGTDRAEARERREHPALIVRRR